MATTSRTGRRAMAAAIGCTAVILMTHRQLNAQVLFTDHFNGSLSGKWSVLREDTSYYDIASSFLDLRACGGDLWLSSNNANNVFLVDNPAAGDFAVTVQLGSFVPSAITNAPQFAVLAYDDDDHHVRCAYGSVPMTGSSGHARGLEFAYESGGFTATGVPCDFGDNPFLLRLEKIDNVYTQYYSIDGAVFHQANDPITYGDGSPTQVGFVAMVDPYKSSRAHVDRFEVAVLPVPEPSSLAMMGVAGILVLPLLRRKRAVARTVRLARRTLSAYLPGLNRPNCAFRSSESSAHGGVLMLAKKKWSIGVLVFALALCLPSFAAASGVSIGLNFVGGSESYNGGGVELMLPGEVAGVVPQAHWNNAGIAGQNNRTANRSGTLTAGSVVDSTGTAVLNLKVDWDAYNTFSTPVPDVPGDYRMMKGYLDTADDVTPATVTVFGLPSLYTSAGYDIIVCFDGYHTIGTQDRVGRYRVFDGADTTGPMLGEVFGRDIYAVDFAGTYTRASGTNAANATAGNYVEFTGLHATTVTIEALGVNSQFPRAPLNSIQIATPVPEPSTFAALALAGVGALCFARHRRRVGGR